MLLRLMLHMHKTQKTLLRLAMITALVIVPLPSLAATRIRTAVPISIGIPKIHVNTKVESKGLTRSGTMQVPSGTSTVAWYNFSVAPGQPGTAVLYGHLTNNSFGPA